MPRSSTGPCACACPRPAPTSARASTAPASRWRCTTRSRCAVAGSGLARRRRRRGRRDVPRGRAAPRRQLAARRLRPARRPAARAARALHQPHPARRAGSARPRPRSWRRSSPRARCARRRRRSTRTPRCALADRLEGHPDNVAACLRGGVDLRLDRAGRRAGRAGRPARRRWPRSPSCRRRARRPGGARRCCPTTVPHGDAVAERLARSTAAARADRRPVAAARRDRGPAAPGLPRAGDAARRADLVAALRADGVPAVISGAGPTVLALVTRGPARGRGPAARGLGGPAARRRAARRARRLTDVRPRAAVAARRRQGSVPSAPGPLIADRRTAGASRCAAVSVAVHGRAAHRDHAPETCRVVRTAPAGYAARAPPPPFRGQCSLPVRARRHHVAAPARHRARLSAHAIGPLRVPTAHPLPPRPRPGTHREESP